MQRCDTMKSKDSFGPRCPTCDIQVQLDAQSKNAPFCSERCRLLDLGRWLSEEHALPCDDGEDEGPEASEGAASGPPKLPPGWHDA